MTKFKKVMLGVFGLCFLAALSLAYAQNAPEVDGPLQKWHLGERVQEIYSRLNLTDDQKQQLEANKQQHRAKMENARQEMKTDREALQQELMKTRLDLPKINGINNQIKSLQSQMEDDRLNSILAVRTILTPEQFLKLENLLRSRRSFVLDKLKERWDERNNHDR